MSESSLVSQPIVEVLASLTDTRTKVAALERLLSDGYVPTETGESGIKWIDERRFLKQCGRLVGPRGSGKSRLCEEYENRDFDRVIRVKAHTNCSSRKVHRLILKAMNHAAKIRRRDDPRPQVVESVEPLGIEVILIDNAHNLEIDAFSDLKDLYDEKKVTIIFSGTANLNVSLDNADLLESFPYSFSLGSLPDNDFRKILNTLEEKALNLPFQSQLSEGEKFEILIKCTGGFIGRLIKLLPTAILYSVQKISEQDNKLESGQECEPETIFMCKLDSVSLEALKKLEVGYGKKALFGKADSQ